MAEQSASGEIGKLRRVPRRCIDQLFVGEERCLRKLEKEFFRLAALARREPGWRIVRTLAQPCSNLLYRVASNVSVIQKSEAANSVGIPGVCPDDVEKSPSRDRVDVLLGGM